MRLATLVQHHPSRADLLPALLARLPADAMVVTDPDPDGVPNPWRCYRACLESVPANATHALIVQDDAVPHPQFPELASIVVGAKPDRIVVMFHASVPPISARRMGARAHSGHRWSDMNSHELLPVVATSWPAGIARSFLEWACEHMRPHDRSDDALASKFIRAKAICPIATIPSLVQHTDDVPSTIRRKQTSVRPMPTRSALIPYDPDEDLTEAGWAPLRDVRVGVNTHV